MRAVAVTIIVLLALLWAACTDVTGPVCEDQLWYVHMTNANGDTVGTYGGVYEVCK